MPVGPRHGNAKWMSTADTIPSRPGGAAAPRPGEGEMSAFALIAPRFDELSILLLGTIFGGIALMIGGIWVSVMNFLIPMGVLIAMGLGIVRALRRSVAAVWTPLVWMRAAIFFYGGFGTLTVLIGNDALRNYAETFFVFYELDILKYNVVIASFAFVFLTASNVLLLAFGGRRSVLEIYRPQRSAIDLAAIGGIFLTTGLVANYLFIVPYQFGFVSTTFPALISEVAQAAFIGLFLSVVALARARSPLLAMVIAIGVLLSFTGLLAFSKSSVLMPLVMLMLGYFYLRPNLTRLILMVVVLMAGFYLSAPIVDHGRYEMQQRYGGIDAPALPDERIEIALSYFDSRSVLAGDQDVDYASLRFSYVNVGSFVISLRDGGQRGNTYENGLAIFVPRAIWKDKPVITEAARQLSFDATGNWNNSVAPGLAPEAYWNDGWFGIVYMGVFLGIVVSFWSIYGLAVQVAGAWYLFPIVLLGVRMGSRFDGFFVSDVMGPIAFGLAGHIALSLGNAAIARRRTSAVQFQQA